MNAMQKNIFPNAILFAIEAFGGGLIAAQFLEGRASTEGVNYSYYMVDALVAQKTYASGIKKRMAST